MKANPALTPAIHAEIRKAAKHFGATVNLDQGDLYQQFERLGAPVGLLQIIGSYQDTQTDRQVLEMLREWNGWAECGSNR